MNAVHLYMLIFTFLMSSTEVFQKGYQLVETKNEIEVYKKVDADTQYEWTKLVTIVSTDIKTLTTFTGNVETLTDWVYACAESKLIEKNADEVIYYTVTNLPYPMSDRDVVVRKKIDYCEKTGSIVSTSRAYKDYKLESKHVRVPRFDSIWFFEPLPNGTTRVTYEISADAGGAIPEWVKHKFSSVGPLKTLENLREKFSIH